MLDKIEIGMKVQPDPSVIDEYDLQHSYWFISNLNKPMTIKSIDENGMFHVDENDFLWTSSWTIPWKSPNKRKFL